MRFRELMFRFVRAREVWIMAEGLCTYMLLAVSEILRVSNPK